MTYGTRPIWSHLWVIIVGILSTTQAITLVGLIVLWVQFNTNKPEALIFIDHDNPFIAARAKEFDLPHVILYYEPVINAIEQYNNDNGNYPPDLETLVPDYLPKVPGIYIRKGERSTYKPSPRTERATVTPFTF
jgi:hypothetical protein